MPIAIENLADAVGAAGSGLAAVADTLLPVTVQVRMRGRRGGSGSGIVWRSDGLIVTNAHVARGERAAVELHDGRVFDGRLERRDPRHDLATIRIEATGLRAARPGDSRRVRPGDLVVACGHPLGMTNVVTAGVVHGVIARPGVSGDPWIRADVRLAPGNSGGPLADADGGVIGVNAMIVNGLGYAVPTHVVERFLRGDAGRGALGITARPVAVAGGVAGGVGLLVLAVDGGGAAESAGIVIGDVLIAADGAHFRFPDDLPETLAPGRATTVDLVRAGRALRLAVTPRASSRAA